VDRAGARAPAAAHGEALAALGKVAEVDLVAQVKHGYTVGT